MPLCRSGRLRFKFLPSGNPLNQIFVGEKEQKATEEASLYIFQSSLFVIRVNLFQIVINTSKGVYSAIKM